MNPLEKIQNFAVKHYDNLNVYVRKKPLATLIHSLAMKTLGLYCKSYFYPLFTFLMASSLVFDIIMIKDFDQYKKLLLKDIDNLKIQKKDQINQLYQVLILSKIDTIKTTFLSYLNEVLKHINLAQFFNNAGTPRSPNNS